MKKNGFTLVELLAVIAILAILVIIALPNIMSMFGDARKNSFTTELKEIYKVAQQQWISDSLYTTGEKVYSRCDGCSGTQLELSGRTQLKYSIKIDKSGKVTNYYATDGTYQYSYEGPGLKIEDINDVDQVANIDPDDALVISGGGVSTVGESKYICKRATALHTEECASASNKGCKKSGYTASGSKHTTTITYGSLGETGTLTAGDAFDCDVNNDGVFNSATERFYYLKSDGENSILIYYNNVKAGVPNNTHTTAYASEHGEGPTVAYLELPTTSQWSHPALVTNYVRQMYTRLKGTSYQDSHQPKYNLPIFTYENRAARFLHTDEIQNGCPNANNVAFITGSLSNEGYFNKCIYYLENTGFASTTIADSWWTETHAESFTGTGNQIYTGIFVVDGAHKGFVGDAMINTENGVRPSIEVPTNTIKY